MIWISSPFKNEFKANCNLSAGKGSFLKKKKKKLRNLKNLYFKITSTPLIFLNRSKCATWPKAWTPESVRLAPNILIGSSVNWETLFLIICEIQKRSWVVE